MHDCSHTHLLKSLCPSPPLLQASSILSSSPPSLPHSLSVSPSPLQIALLQQYPQLKQYIRPAVEKAVQDLVPVAERSIKIALTTTEHIIRRYYQCTDYYTAVHIIPDVVS